MLIDLMVFVIIFLSYIIIDFKDMHKKVSEHIRKANPVSEMDPMEKLIYTFMLEIVTCLRHIQ